MVRTALLIGGMLMLASGCSLSQPATTTARYDVIVYGATAGGIIAAIAAASEGLSVALLEPHDHVGGMVSGGLGATDFGRKSVIGGMSREFFERAGKHYGQPIAWYFEPHVAEQILRDWLSDAGVKVFFHSRLAETLDAVTKEGRRIERIRMEDGRTFTAAVFIDSSYEGDLMARAGVSYTVGREGMDEYGESLAGRREVCQYHQFQVKVSPYDDDGKLLPCVYAGDATPVGGADKKVQAYNFRMCLCSRKDNQVPFPKPANYDPHRYELLKRYLQAAPDLTLNKLIHIMPMPNDKTDLNNNGAFSTDHIGGSWDYPDANYQRRQQIWDDHVSYVMGFFYFLANDPSVPKPIQDELNTWGLAKDEFVDTGHWPHQLYIREARRMIGTYVMHQADLQTDRTKPDSIGMGSYNSDSHHVQRVPTEGGGVINEGDMQVHVQPYEIAYRAIVPKKEQAENLFVPVCFSASHVAYSSMRMEPQYMIMGHAAGVAAAYAIRQKVPIADVDVAWLQEKLRAQRQVLSLAEAIVEGVDLSKFEGVVVDNTSAVLSGDWRSSTSITPFVGIDYLHDDNAEKGKRSSRFVPGLSEGNYEVRIAFTASANRATNVPVLIRFADGERVVLVNQREKPASAPFLSLGTYHFPSGRQGCVEVSNRDTDGYVVVDAVQWIKQK